MVTAGTDDAQVLKDSKPTSCPESDDNGNDYSADDETSSQSRSVCDSEPGDYCQNSKSKHRLLISTECTLGMISVGSSAITR